MTTTCWWGGPIIICALCLGFCACVTSPPSRLCACLFSPCDCACDWTSCGARDPGCAIASLSCPGCVSASPSCRGCVSACPFCPGCVSACPFCPGCASACPFCPGCASVSLSCPGCVSASPSGLVDCVTVICARPCLALAADVHALAPGLAQSWWNSLSEGECGGEGESAGRLRSVCMKATIAGSVGQGGTCEGLDCDRGFHDSHHHDHCPCHDWCLCCDHCLLPYSCLCHGCCSHHDHCLHDGHHGT